MIFSQKKEKSSKMFKNIFLKKPILNIVVLLKNIYFWCFEIDLLAKIAKTTIKQKLKSLKKILFQKKGRVCTFIQQVLRDI